MSAVPPDCASDHPGCEHSPQMLRARDHATELRGAGKRSLALALVLITGYMFVEVVGGLLSGSLALIADAGHMLTDAASIGLALAAMHFATRPASTRRTFGYHRLEILAALVNGLTLVGISIWVIVEAYQRFSTHRRCRAAWCSPSGRSVFWSTSRRRGSCTVPRSTA